MIVTFPVPPEGEIVTFVPAMICETPDPAPIAPQVPLWQLYCVPVEITCWLGSPLAQEPLGAVVTLIIEALGGCANTGVARSKSAANLRILFMVSPRSKPR